MTGCLLLAAPSSQAAGNDASPLLEGLFGARATLENRALTGTYETHATPSLQGLTRQQDEAEGDNSQQSVEAFAAKLWYAGAVLLTADRLFRSMDSVLESAQIEGRNDQRFGLDLSSSGVGMVLRFERGF